MKSALLAGATFFALAPTLAGAAPLPAGGLTLDEVAKWLQGAGYKASITTEGDTKLVESASDGTTFYIKMEDCNAAPRCTSLEFFVGFETHGAWNAQKMNEWNTNYRWLRARVDGSNDPWGEMDVDLSPGGSYELLNEEFGVWRKALLEFKKFLKL